MSNNNHAIDGLVSVVMPSYNSAQFIMESVQSVIDQSYKNWELIIVDDHSTDGTRQLLDQLEDERIQVIKLEVNWGAAVARNRAIENAGGEFLAFLDSDDKWESDKLRTQVEFMQENNCTFTSTNYKEIDEEGNPTGGVVKAREKLDYNGVLKYCPGNSTIIYNAKELGKFYVPSIRKRNDFVMWLQVIKEAGYVYGIDKNLTLYRVRENSLSIDKKSLIKYQWKVYREIEKLSLPKSTYLLGHKIINILNRRKSFGQ